MKKLVTLLLALVVILALAGCDVSSRPYSRYPYSTTDLNKTVTQPYGGTTYNRSYRPGTGSRTINPSDAPLYYNNNNTTGSTGNARTGITTPDAANPTTPNSTLRGRLDTNVPGMPSNTATPRAANPARGAELNLQRGLDTTAR